MNIEQAYNNYVSFNRLSHLVYFTLTKNSDINHNQLLSSTPLKSSNYKRSLSTFTFVVLLNNLKLAPTPVKHGGKHLRSGKHHGKVESYIALRMAVLHTQLTHRAVIVSDRFQSVP